MQAEHDGFHLTEVGRIPRDWQCVRLETVARRITVGIASAATHAYRDKGILMLRNQNITEDGIKDADVLYLDPEFEALHRRKRLMAGDILTIRTGYPGLSAVVPKRLEGSQSFTTLITRLDDSLADSDYVCAFINSPLGDRFFYCAEAGGARKNVNAGVLRRLPLALPPLEEQRRIAEVSQMLSQLQFGVAAQIRSKRQLKRGLMQQLPTGKRRFSGFVRSCETAQTRYGSFPTDWDHIRVGDIASEVSDRAEHASGTVPVLSCTKHRGLVESAKYFGKRVFSDDTANYRLVRRGQFAYATNHIEEGSIGLLTEIASGLVSPMYTVFSTTERVYAPFLYALFKTELYRQVFQVNTSASVDRRGSLRWSQFARLPLFLPSLAEQRRIVEVLETCDREIASLDRQLELLKDQKKGLMQRLLTGQIRVPAPKEAAR